MDNAPSDNVYHKAKSYGNLKVVCLFTHEETYVNGEVNDGLKLYSNYWYKVSDAFGVRPLLVCEKSKLN